MAKIIGTIHTKLSDIAELLKGASVVMMIRILGAGITYGSHVLLARWMGAFEFGIFAFAWVWVTVLGFLAPLGFSVAVVRFIPDYVSKNKWNRVHGLIRRSQILVFTMSLVLALTAALIVFLFSDVISDYYLTPLYIAFIAIAFFALTDLHEGFSRSFNWLTLAYIPSYVFRPAAIVILIGLAIVFGIPANANVAMWAALIASILALIGQAFVFRTKLIREKPFSRPIYHSSYWLKNALPFLLVETFYIILSNTDLLLLGKYLQPDIVGVYYAALRTSGLISFIMFAVAAFSAPKFSALYAGKDNSKLARLFAQSVNLTFWPSLVAAIILLVLGKPILNLFGNAFLEGYQVLFILTFSIVFKAAAGPVDFLLNMTGNQNRCAAILGISAIINIVLNLLLIPNFGMLGAACGTAVSVIFSTILMTLFAKKKLGIQAFSVNPYSIFTNNVK